MMKILAHRGLWRECSLDPNSMAAFRAAFAEDFGLETDVRDCVGRLVISHDPPLQEAPAFADLLAIYEDSCLQLAINIKADGLAQRVRDAMANSNIRNWFVFDMSIPDTMSQIEVGNPVFIRNSEYEHYPYLVKNTEGIWLDMFNDIWYGHDALAAALEKGYVCVVSAELHEDRKHLPQWELLQEFVGNDKLLLCTDWPLAARKFFEL